MKRILVLNHYAGSTHHGMEFRTFLLARRWAQAGNCVKVVAASFSHLRTRQPETSGRITLDRIADVEFEWVRTPPYHGNGLRRVINIATFVSTVWWGAARLAADFRPDVVIASSTYPMDVWPAHRIASIANAQLIYEVHDLWPLSPIELGGMSRLHPFIVMTQAAEDFALKNADRVVSVLPNALEYMQSRGMSPHKFAYIPNGIESDEWIDPEPLPTEVDEQLGAIRARGMPIVGYAGGHGLSNALDVLLDSSPLLQNRASIVLVGGGPERNRLARRVLSENLSNVFMLPAVPKRAIPTLLSSFDVAYIGWHRNPLYRFGISPNKLMDYMMAGIPIVHSVAASNDSVCDARCGFTVPPGDPEAVAAGISHILELSQQERAEMGQRGRNYILREQTYEILASRFLDLVSAR